MGRMCREALSAEDLALIERQCAYGTWSGDLKAGKLFWSDGIYHLLGLEPGSVEPAPHVIFSLLHPEDRSRAEQRWANLEDHEESVLDFRIIRSSGSIRRVRSHMRVVFDNWVPIRVIGIWLDITELHQARVNASEADRRYTGLMRSVSSIAWEVEPDGAVLSCSSFCAFTGLKAHEAQGWAWLERVHEKNRPALRNAWLDAVRWGKSFAMTLLVMDRGGQWNLSAFRAAPITFRNLDGTYAISHICVDLQRCEWAFLPDQSKDVPSLMGDGGEKIVTGALMRAARGLLDWPAKTLAHKSGVSLSTIRRMEAEGVQAHRDMTASMIQVAFERAGVEFLPLPDGSIALKLSESR